MSSDGVTQITLCLHLTERLTCTKSTFCKYCDALHVMLRTFGFGFVFPLSPAFFSRWRRWQKWCWRLVLEEQTQTHKVLMLPFPQVSQIWVHWGVSFFLFFFTIQPQVNHQNCFVKNMFNVGRLLHELCRGTFQDYFNNHFEWTVVGVGPSLNINIYKLEQRSCVTASQSVCIIWFGNE